MKFKKFCALILAASLLSGCAVREDYSEYISEPVLSAQSDSVTENSVDIPDISIDDTTDNEISFDKDYDPDKYSNMGAVANFADEETMEYNGKPITCHVAVDGTNGNTADLEHGISLFINGFRQVISVNGSEPTEMYIKTYEPDRGDLLEITFDPRILEKDKDKTMMYVNIIEFWFPTYDDERYHNDLKSIRGASPGGAAPMYINTPIKNYVSGEQEQIELIEKTPKNMASHINGYGEPGSIGASGTYIDIQPAKDYWDYITFYANDDNSGDISVYSALEDNMTYRVTLFGKDGMLTFNDGKNYLEMENKKKTLCFANVNIPDLKPDDFIYAVFTPIKIVIKDEGIFNEYGERYYSTAMTSSLLYVADPSLKQEQ